MILGLILVLLSAVFLYYYIVSLKNVWKGKGIFHLKRYPIFGNIAPTFFLRESIPDFGRRIYNSPKDNSTKLVGFYIFSRPALLIRDPSILRYILIQDFSNFSRRSFYMSKKHDPVAASNLFTDGTPRWKSLRASISPIFTGGKLKKMFTVMNEVSADLLNKLKTEKKSVYNIRELSAMYMTDIVSTTALGLKANCLSHADSEFNRLAPLMFNTKGSNYWRTFTLFISVLSPFLVDLLRTRFFSQEATDMLSEIFWGIVKHREEEKFVRNDLIDLLIQLKNKGKIEGDGETQETTDSSLGVSKLEIMGITVSFFAAGFETTSGTIQFTLFELAFHQDMQDRLRAEIHDTMKKYNGELTYDAIQEMKYLSCCVDEALRKYSLTGILNRLCVADYQIPGTDIVIDKGTEIFICMEGLHLNPEYFPDPQKYDPERFSDARKHEIKAFTYLPFGDGPRNCIGMRFGSFVARYGVAVIMANYKLEPSPELSYKIEFSNQSFFNVPIHPIDLKFTPIQH